MYNPSDVYVEGGLNDLLVCWTDKVTTFDASSFYNWEQDNLPILDLEERTHLLWERFGHPTSAMTGMSFVVSADAVSSCSPLYFNTLSSCLAALPEVINYPILIEVASFGDLGDLVISNKIFGPRGSLQIINRNSAFNGSLEAAGKTINTEFYHGDTYGGYLASSVRPDGPNASAVCAMVSPGVALSVTSTQSVSALGSPLGCSFPNNFIDHACASIWTTTRINGNPRYSFISSSLGTVSLGGYDVPIEMFKDMRFSSTGFTAFTRKTDYLNNRMTACLNATGTVGGRPIPFDGNLINVSGTNVGINLRPFEYDPQIKGTGVYRNLDHKNNIYDASTISLKDLSVNKWGDGTEGFFKDVVLPNPATALSSIFYAGPVPIDGRPGAGCTTFSYINRLNSIKVYNCAGPIYISNFVVDSENKEDHGISIENSNVTLERCAATRCNKSGLYASNSRVDVLRGFVAYRIYGFEFDHGNSRIGTPYLDKINNYAVQNPLKAGESYGAGIRAENSTIAFENTYSRQWDKLTNIYREQVSVDEGSVSYTPGGYTQAYQTFGQGLLPSPASENLYCLSRNDIGIHAKNSSILGGKNEVQTSSTSTSWDDAYRFYIEDNTEAGIRLENSNLENSGRMHLYGNFVGLDAYDSTMAFDVLKAQYNQNEAIKLYNSDFVYGKDLYRSYMHGQDWSTIKSRNIHQVTLVENGSHIKSVNSTIRPLDCSSYPELYQAFNVSGCTGQTASGDGTGLSLTRLLPAISLLDSSEMEAVHLAVDRWSDDRDYGALYGSLVEVSNNSKLVTRGSSKYATRLCGPVDKGSNIVQAGMYANNNSTISFQGPTVIASLGVDALADNNSKIEFVPLRNSDGQLLASSFNLSDTSNHTTVELHSTRACLVANNNSEINMEDLGDYRDIWSHRPHGTSVDAGATFDYLEDGFTTQAPRYRTYVSGGYLQFYPNGFAPGDSAIVDLGTVGSPILNTSSAFSLYPATVISSVGNYYLTALSQPTNEAIGGFGKLSTGGMCVRALNGSLVNANNVHFPTGWFNTSGIIYDLSGNIPNCTRLYIWNIADNSLLKASYLSVSGSHPKDAGYHGPSGIWLNQFSGAPSSTPDTSAISILDFYGKIENASSNPFTMGHTSATFQNLGPFRLYFSTDPVVNWLVSDDLTASGYLKQVFSQGYQASANSFAANTDIFNCSSENFSVLRRDDITQNIYPSGFYYASEMMYSPETVKCVLDESAANAFANAKHNAVNKSNLAKVVHILYPYTDGHRVGTDSGGSWTDDDARPGLGLASVNYFDLEKNN